MKTVFLFFFNAMPRFFSRLLFLLLFLSPFLSGCKKGMTPIPTGDHITGLASPVQLNADSTLLFLSDYLDEPSSLSSWTLPAGFTARMTSDSSQMWIFHPDSITPTLSTMALECGSSRYDLLLRRSRKQTVVLSYTPREDRPNSVYFVGDMNGWNPTKSPMSPVAGSFRIDLNLDPGFYPYQFVADGEWTLDPENPLQRDNGAGGLNSLLEVKATDPNLLPRLRTIRPLDDPEPKLLIGLDRAPGTLLVFWENHLLPDAYQQKGDSGVIQLSIPKEAAGRERSHLRVYAHNESGESNDLLIPLQKGKVVMKADGLGQLDLHQQRMYFVFVDRFFNGDSTNDRPVNDPRVHPRANYWGGDIAGIINRIESGYFRDLGVNSIWISPIGRNPDGAYQEWPEPRRFYSGYHGYWPTSSSQVDPRMGTEAELKQLIDVAHRNGIRVLLDYVANHVHQEHPLMQQHPDWKTPLELPDGRKNIRIWDEHRLTTWFDTFMPSLDLERPEVAEAMSDSALYWMTQYDFDGFRHDATKHIPEDFWRRLSHKLKTQVVKSRGRPLYQIGETFGSRELIGQYIGSGMIDAQFDFNLYFDARSMLANDQQPLSRLWSSLDESMRYYGHHHLMGNISGNHDLARFITYASGALRFDEDDRAAGWGRDIQIKDTLGYPRLRQLLSFITSIPGVPVVYYGDDIGMPGAGDPDNRRPMRFTDLSDQEMRTRLHVSTLYRLRGESMALTYGETELIETGDNRLAFLRNYFGEGAVVCINRSAEEQTFRIPVPAHFRRDEIMGNLGNPLAMADEQTLVTTVAPYSTEIITFK